LIESLTIVDHQNHRVASVPDNRLLAAIAGDRLKAVGFVMPTWLLTLDCQNFIPDTHLFGGFVVVNQATSRCLLAQIE